MEDKMKQSVIAVLLAAVLAAPVFAENLVPNGDFKKFDAQKGNPEGWVFSRWNEVVEEGPGVTPVLRMCSNYRSRNTHWKGNALVVIPKIPAGKYKFSLKVKGAASMIYFFLMPPKNSGVKGVVKDCRKITMKPLADGWKYGEYPVSFAKDVTKVSLSLECFFANYGEYEYVADVKLEPVK